MALKLQSVFKPCSFVPSPFFMPALTEWLSQLILDLGAHHLDLMFSDERNPPCFSEARKIETEMIWKWCQQAYDAHAP